MAVIRKIQKLCPNAKYMHYKLHREALVTKRYRADLNTVVNETVITVNFIKGRALFTRIFHNLCDENNYFFTVVTWLWRKRQLS